MLLRAHGFPGPTALLTGPADTAAIDFAIGVLLRYSKNYDVDGAAVIVLTSIIYSRSWLSWLSRLSISARR